MRDITPLHEALNAYAQGAFPMAERRDSPDFHWYTAPVRSLLPIDLHVPRSLKKLVRKAPFEVRVDTDFAGVIDGCALPRTRQPTTWINRGIREMMIALHKAGFAHSVECWKDGRLVGGVYGTALGGTFCGESMFSREPGASKVALVHLCARLKAGGFQLFDTQFLNDHVAQFGAYEMPHATYVETMQRLLIQKTDFHLSGQAFMTERERIAIFLKTSRPFDPWT